MGVIVNFWTVWRWELTNRRIASGRMEKETIICRNDTTVNLCDIAGILSMYFLKDHSFIRSTITVANQSWCMLDGRIDRLIDIVRVRHTSSCSHTTGWEGNSHAATFIAIVAVIIEMTIDFCVSINRHVQWTNDSISKFPGIHFLPGVRCCWCCCRSVKCSAISSPVHRGRVVDAIVKGVQGRIGVVVCVKVTKNTVTSFWNRIMHLTTLRWGWSRRRRRRPACCGSLCSRAARR